MDPRGLSTTGHTLLPNCRSSARIVLLLGWLVTAVLTSHAALAAITFVQANGTWIGGAQSSTTVSYAAAQSAGNLNVVAVGWQSSAVSVSSVTDSKGNTYVLAVGPTTSSGATSQSIYYAKNIVAATAGSNTVTVTFSSSVGSNVRIAEYGGMDASNPLDVTTGATGTGTLSSSGAVTTTNASDLLFAASYVQNTTTGAGSGFIERNSTGGDGIEDRIVSATGSYSATAPQDVSGYYIMQLAAFKAASGGGDTQPPSTPTNLSANAVASTQINLSWTTSTDNVAVTGYLVERCQGAGCSNFAQIATPATTSYNDTGRSPSTSYSYRVRARDAVPNYSAYSITASATTPAAPDTQPPTTPSNLSATAVSSTQINLSWNASTDNVGVTNYLVERCQGVGCSNFAQIATPATTNYNDTGRSPSTSYSYRVRAQDAVPNYSAYSTTASATTPAASDTQPPTAPSGLTVTAGVNTNLLGWTASTDNVGVTAYLIERCQGASCSSFAQIGTSAITLYTDNTAVAGTSYSYRVRARDAVPNFSGYSNTGTSTPAHCD